MFCVNLPINTNFFNNNSVKSFRKACNKATKSIKSKLEAKLNNSDEPTAYTSGSIRNHPVVTKFLAANKKELVDGMIQHVAANIEETKRVVKQRVQLAVQTLSDSLDPSPDPEDTIYEIFSGRSMGVVEAHLFEQITVSESDDETIFDSTAPTPKQAFCNENPYNILHTSNPKMKIKPDIYKQPIVSQFMMMVEAKAKQQNQKVINDTSICVGDFFRMVAKHQNIETVSFYETSDFFTMSERDHESKAKVPLITVDYIWLKIQEILSQQSGNQDLQLFKLSQLEIRNSKNEFLREGITDLTRTKSSKRIPSHSTALSCSRRFRKSIYS